VYSEKVLEHLEHPRNVGAIDRADARGEAENPVCGDLLHLYLRTEGGRIAEAGFQAQGCPPTIAAASVLTELIAGRSIEEARALEPDDVTRALQTLPRNKAHCAVLAIDALRSALAQLSPRVL
jgi:nitrogen fixation NifU-like protein